MGGSFRLHFELTANRGPWCNAQCFCHAFGPAGEGRHAARHQDGAGAAGAARRPHDRPDAPVTEEPRAQGQDRPRDQATARAVTAITARPAAIVSAIAGTTRDVIEVHLDLGGIPAVVADTAGLREATDVIEAEGVRRATAWARGADIRILVGAADDWTGLYRPEVRSATTGVDPVLLVVGNKVDLAPTPPFLDGRPVLPVSVKSGEGMDRLVAELERQAQESQYQARALAARRGELQRVIETASEQVKGNLQAGEQMALELEQIALKARIAQLLEERKFPLPPTDWPAIPWPPF